MGSELKIKLKKEFDSLKSKGNFLSHPPVDEFMISLADMHEHIHGVYYLNS